MFSLLVQTDFEHIFHVIKLTAPPRINLLSAEVMQKELGGKIYFSIVTFSNACSCTIMHYL